MVVKPKNINKLAKKYLLYTLKQTDLSSTISGSAQPQITRQGLFPFKIPLPPLEVQEKIVAEIEGYQNIIDGAEQILTNWKPTIKIDPKWPTVALGEVCETISGQSPDSKHYNSDGEGLPFYQGKSEFCSRYVGDPVKWTTHPLKIAKKHDILMSVRAPVGPVNFSTQEVCIGRGLAAIRGNSSSLVQEFLFYLLKGKESEITGTAGSTFASISRKEIQSLKIPLPPLDVQEKIVAEIEKERALVETSHETIACFKKKIAVVIDDVWGYTEDGDGHG